MQKLVLITEVSERFNLAEERCLQNYRLEVSCRLQNNLSGYILYDLIGVICKSRNLILYIYFFIFKKKFCLLLQARSHITCKDHLKGHLKLKKDFNFYRLHIWRKIIRPKNQNVKSFAFWHISRILKS